MVIYSFDILVVEKYEVLRTFRKCSLLSVSWSAYLYSFPLLGLRKIMVTSILLPLLAAP